MIFFLSFFALPLTFTVCSWELPKYVLSPLNADMEYEAGPPARAYAIKATKKMNCGFKIILN